MSVTSAVGVTDGVGGSVSCAVAVGVDVRVHVPRLVLVKVREAVGVVVGVMGRETVSGNVAEGVPESVEGLVKMDVALPEALWDAETRAVGLTEGDGVHISVTVLRRRSTRHEMEQDLYKPSHL